MLSQSVPKCVEHGHLSEWHWLDLFIPLWQSCLLASYTAKGKTSSMSAAGLFEQIH